MDMSDIQDMAMEIAQEEQFFTLNVIRLLIIIILLWINLKIIMDLLIFNIHFILDLILAASFWKYFHRPFPSECF
jgi:hypothetical protein